MATYQGVSFQFGIDLGIFTGRVESPVFKLEYDSSAILSPHTSKIFINEHHLGHALLLRKTQEKLAFGIYDHSYINFFCGGSKEQDRKPLAFVYADEYDWVEKELIQYSEWQMPVRLFSTLTESKLEEKLGRFAKNWNKKNNVLEF